MGFEGDLVPILSNVEVFLFCDGHQIDFPRLLHLGEVILDLRACQNPWLRTVVSAATISASGVE